MIFCIFLANAIKMNQKWSSVPETSLLSLADVTALYCWCSGYWVFVCIGTMWTLCCQDSPKYSQFICFQSTGWRKMLWNQQNHFHRRTLSMNKRGHQSAAEARNHLAGGWEFFPTQSWRYSLGHQLKYTLSIWERIRGSTVSDWLMLEAHHTWWHSK